MSQSAAANTIPWAGLPVTTPASQAASASRADVAGGKWVSELLSRRSINHSPAGQQVALYHVVAES